MERSELPPKKMLPVLFPGGPPRRETAGSRVAFAAKPEKRRHLAFAAMTGSGLIHR